MSSDDFPDTPTVGTSQKRLQLHFLAKTMKTLSANLSPTGKAILLPFYDFTTSSLSTVSDGGSEFVTLSIQNHFGYNFVYLEA